MLGLMQDWPLLVSRILDHATTNHGHVEIVSWPGEGPAHRYTYRDCCHRAKMLAQALERYGIERGDRVATLAWNSYRHLEVWFGVSGLGAVVHTVNPRLFEDQLVYIINHAEDRILMVDLTLLPIVEKLAPELESIETYVLLADEDHMPPSTSLDKLICYERFIAAEDGEYDWPTFDENTAAGLCYTSGTTGKPKGVLYSHRSNFLITMAAAWTDTLAVCAKDAVLPIVPMFHANAWAIPYVAAATGAKLVLNGPNFDGESIHDMIEKEQVTLMAGVPTVWLMLLDHLRKTKGRLDSVKRVAVGGAAAPCAMIEEFQKNYDVQVVHAWGMTETSPLGTVGTMTARTLRLPEEEKLALQCKQGRAILGVELKIVDDDGNELPRDGKTFGRLLVRGPWIAKAYFKGDTPEMFDAEGWFDTGDVATIDQDSFMQITDRAKDVIKSGGEWISSIEIENLAVGHPDVAEAAVIGVHHPKWDERPLLILVPQPGKHVGRDEMLKYLDGKIANWWMPDDVVDVNEIPHTATGKINKRALRDQFRDYQLPES